MSESFELKVPETIQVAEESLIRVIAKTLSDTLHPDDPNHPHRVFEESELTLAARSLALKPVGLNHREMIPDAIVVNADWNLKDKVVEAILSLPQRFRDLIRKKEIEKVSVDYIWDSVEKKEGKSIFKGLKFIGLSLLHGLSPGDPNTNILFESQSGRETLEITVKGEPLDAHGCEPNEHWDEEQGKCVLNETPGQEQDGEVPTTEEDCKAKGWHWYDDACHKEPKAEEPTSEKKLEEALKRVTELEEAVQRVIKNNEDLKKLYNKDVKAALDQGRSEALEEVATDLKKIIPSDFIQSRFKQISAVRLSEDLKRIMRKVESDGSPSKS